MFSEDMDKSLGGRFFNSQCTRNHRRRKLGAGEHVPPPQKKNNRENIFRAIIMQKFVIFSDKIM